MSSEHKGKRVIVHIKQANEITGLVSKKGKSTSDCYALVTLLGSSPLQKFSTETIKKTTVKKTKHLHSPSFIFLSLSRHFLKLKPIITCILFPLFSLYRTQFGINGSACNPHSYITLLIHFKSHFRFIL